MIKTITVGDRVLAREPETGRLVEALVIRKDIHEGLFPMLGLMIGSERLVVHNSHMMLLQDGGWLPAGALRPGDELAGRYGQRVISIDNADCEDRVYNIAVDRCGNYLVGEVAVVASDGSELMTHPPMMLNATKRIN